MMDMNDKTNTKKIEVPQQLQEQEKKRFTWKSGNSPTEASTDSKSTQSGGPKFGSSGIVLLSALKQSVCAHRSWAICVRYEIQPG